MRNCWVCITKSIYWF